MKTVFCIFFLFCCGLNLAAQGNLQLGTDFSFSDSRLRSTAPGLGLHLVSPPVTTPFMESRRNILPGYVRQNPQNFSFLCQLELEVEKKLPVGMWVKIDEQSGTEGAPRSWAYFRLKLLKF